MVIGMRTSGMLVKAVVRAISRYWPALKHADLRHARQDHSEGYAPLVLRATCTETCGPQGHARQGRSEGIPIGTTAPCRLERRTHRCR